MCHLVIRLINCLDNCYSYNPEYLKEDIDSSSLDIHKFSIQLSRIWLYFFQSFTGELPSEVKLRKKKLNSFLFLNASYWIIESYTNTHTHTTWCVYVCVKQLYVLVKLSNYNFCFWIHKMHAILPRMSYYED